MEGRFAGPTRYEYLRIGFVYERAPASADIHEAGK